MSLPLTGGRELNQHTSPLLVTCGSASALHTLRSLMVNRTKSCTLSAVTAHVSLLTWHWSSSLHDLKSLFPGRTQRQGQGSDKKLKKKKKLHTSHIVHFFPLYHRYNRCIHQTTLSANFPVGNMLHFTLCVCL